MTFRDDSGGGSSDSHDYASVRQGDLGQVGDRRTGVEVLEHAIPALVLAQASHPAGRIPEIAEDDGVGWAGLGAGGGELAVPERPIFQPSVVLRAPDALNAEGALLHDPAGPHGDVRIQLQLQRLPARPTRCTCTS